MATCVSRITDYELNTRDLHGHGINIVTYRIGQRFACRIENQDVGLTVCTVFGESKREALRAGLLNARDLFKRTPYTSPRVLADSERSIAKIILQLDGEQIFFAPSEFLALSMADRMNHILGGKLSFFDESSTLILAGEAIELLRRIPSEEMLQA